MFTRNHAVKLPRRSASRAESCAQRAPAQGVMSGFARPCWSWRGSPARSVLACGWTHRQPTNPLPPKGLSSTAKSASAGRGTRQDQWASLSVELPLPLDLLSVGKTAELSISDEARDPLLGPALGMSHLLWVPVFGRNLLRGLILVAAQRAGQSASASACGRRRGSELALALENEEQSRLARERKADLELATRVHALLAENADLDQVLAELAENCTRSDGPAGVGRRLRPDWRAQDRTRGCGSIGRARRGAFADSRP